VTRALLVIITAAVIWLAGEQHRSSCLLSARVGCSVLPWDSGDAGAAPRLDPSDLRDLHQALEQQRDP
jgi:hypothetical protein